MKILLFIPAMIPPKNYGGTERVVHWLAKGLDALGYDVSLAAKKGSYINSNIKIVEIPDKIDDLNIYFRELAKDYDIVNFHNKIHFEPDIPYLHTMHGHPYIGEFMPNNTNFVSRKHMELYGGKAFVYHGLDIDEYSYCDKKEDYFAFLSKTTVKYKNLKYALELAKKTKINLHIGGGYGLSFNKRIKYFGMVDGEKKLNLLMNSKALIFPTLAEESFGLVSIEAMACGTPVIASNKGAQPEIVSKEVGFICNSDDEYINAVKNVGIIKYKECREYVEANFNHKKMAENYVKMFEKVLNSKNKKL